MAAQLYLSVDLVKEAVDTLTVTEEWNKARKIAKELGSAYESYVESKYKDRLLQEGNVEQLADVGKKISCNIYRYLFCHFLFFDFCYLYFLTSAESMT